MKPSTLFFIIIVVLIGIGLYDSGIHRDSVLVQTQEERFTGVLQEVDTSCFADGVCYAQVDDRKVILMQGFKGGALGDIRGSEDGISGLVEHIGREVEVFAAKYSEGYTLYGSEEYYLEVM